MRNWCQQAAAAAARGLVVLFAALMWVSATGAALAQPTVTNVDPWWGTGVGGSVVTITGTGFQSGATVLFGTIPATSVVVNDPTSITATTPASLIHTFGGVTSHTLGNVDVSVTVNGDTGTLPYGYNYSDYQPGYTSVSPSSGPASGGTSVTFIGSNFTNASQVNFGNVPATSFSVDDDQTITAIAPPGTGTVDVVVYNATGTDGCCSDAATRFTYVPAPTVTKLVRNGGSTAGGDTVVLTGSAFTGATAVAFGATPAASFTINSATQITAVTPAGSGNVNVSVTTPGGTSATAAANLFYYGALQPVITHMGPDKGAEAGGVAIVILGSGFTGTSQVFFGTTPAPSFSVQSDGEIWTDYPPGTGAVDVIVEAPGGDSAPGSTFTYFPTPGTISLTPNSGPEAGGTAVTLTGSGFAGDMVIVYFGSLGAAGVTINSDTSLTAISPPGTGTVDVKVETRGGFSPVAAFTYVPPGPPADSVKVEQLQDQFSPIVARNSGRAITGAVAKGIALGFGSGGPTANVGLGAESAFMAYAPEAAATNAFDGFDGPGFINPADQWSLWLDVQGSGLLSGGSGQQLNLTGGVGYRFTDDFIAGIIGGQESFSYSADGNGLLSGSGLSAGGYVAWQFSEHGMLDAALVGTALGYKVSSGTATGQFDASRWLVTSGLTGEFELGENLTISPSARVTALWESQEGWTDSLATEHAAKAFSDGTASGGVTFSGQWLLLEDMTLLPYFGLFADYRFDTSGGATTSGLEGRMQAGVRLNVSPSAAINVGGELGGLFSEQRTWSLNAGVSGGF